MIARSLETKALEMASKFPIVSITGPRQSGKSTLVKAAFPSYRYVNLEDEDMRAFAVDDPRSFLQMYPAGTIIDEAQRAPSLFSYLQGTVDSTDRPGQYIISGSQNFLLLESISQSLAGRVAILNLLPLSHDELDRAGMLPKTLNSWMYAGGYPRIYAHAIDPADFYPSYIQTYLERDVRQTLGVQKLAEFERFLTLCASRTGGMLNKEGLSRDCGVTVKTIEHWLSVLEASFIALRLQPYYRNFGKRLVKAPKLYLCDTGLACSLLGVEHADELATSPLRGALFETAVVSEILKAALSRGRQLKLYYWRDAGKQEADLVIEKGSQPWRIIEIKSSATYHPKFFANITGLGELMGIPAQRRYVVYAGDRSFETSRGAVITPGDIASTLAYS